MLFVACVFAGTFSICCVFRLRRGSQNLPKITKNRYKIVLFFRSPIFQDVSTFLVIFAWFVDAETLISTGGREGFCISAKNRIFTVSTSRNSIVTHFWYSFGGPNLQKSLSGGYWKNTIFLIPIFWFFVDFLQFKLEIKNHARSKNRWKSLQNASKIWPDFVLSIFQDFWWCFIDFWAIFTGLFDDFLMILYHFESLSAGRALQILPPPLSILILYPSTFSLLACILPLFLFFS